MMTMTSVTLFLFLTELRPASSKQTYAHVWPLSNDTCHLDLVTGSGFSSSCPLPAGLSHPELQYQSLSLNGSESFDLQVAALGGNEDVTFTLCVRPTWLSGTVLHYHSDSASSRLRSLKASLTATGGVLLSVETDEMRTTKTFPMQLTPSMWTCLAIGVEEESCRFRVTALNSNGSEISYSVDFESCESSLGPEVGNLTIGASSDGSDGFEGDVTCACVVRGTTKPNFSESFQQCLGVGQSGRTVIEGLTAALVDTVTPKTSAVVNTPPMDCMCRPVSPNNSRSVTESLTAGIKELAVNKTELSSVRRRVTSAPDPRASSIAMGTVSIACITILPALILLADLTRVIRWVQTPSKKGKTPLKPEQLLKLENEAERSAENGEASEISQKSDENIADEKETNPVEKTQVIKNGAKENFLNFPGMITSTHTAGGTSQAARGGGPKTPSMLTKQGEAGARGFRGRGGRIGQQVLGRGQFPVARQ